MSETVVCCDVNEYPSIKNMMGNNYEMLVKLDNILYAIGQELKKDEIPSRSDAVVNDMTSALTEQNKMLCRCVDHAFYIMNTLGITEY